HPSVFQSRRPLAAIGSLMRPRPCTRRVSWRTHSCVPRRDSSRCLLESSSAPGLDTSVEAAGTSACATALVAAPLLCEAAEAHPSHSAPPPPPVLSPPSSPPPATPRSASLHASVPDRSR